MSKLRLQM